MHWHSPYRRFGRASTWPCGFSRFVDRSSRVVLLAHHPSDAAAGALVGIVGAPSVRYWFAARRLGFKIVNDGMIVPPGGASGYARALSAEPFAPRSGRRIAVKKVFQRDLRDHGNNPTSPAKPAVAVSTVVPVRNEENNVAVDRRDRRRSTAAGIMRSSTSMTVRPTDGSGAHRIRDARAEKFAPHRPCEIVRTVSGGAKWGSRCARRDCCHARRRRTEQSWRFYPT